MILRVATKAGQGEESLEQVARRVESGEIFWLDIDNPTLEEMVGLGKIFPFHELSLEDCATLSELPKVEEFEEYLFVVIHGHGFDKETQEFEQRELNLFLCSNYLVTIHQVQHHSIDAVWAQVGKDPAILKQGADALFHRLVDFVVERYFPLFSSWEDDLEELEEKVLEGEADHVVEEIMDFKRRVVKLRRSLNPQREIFRVLANHENEFISDRVRIYLRDTYDHMYRIYEELEGLRDLLTSMMDVYRSNISLKMNDVMKKLTIVATVFMPLTFIVGLYGMNVKFPLFEENRLWPFFDIVGTMFLLVVGMLWFFKRKRWL